VAPPEVDDALGLALLAEYETPGAGDHVLERDDGFVRCDQGSLYFTGPDDWYPGEAAGLACAFGTVLDIGSGAGRHALALQERGLAVTALDSSPGAAEVCRRRRVGRVVQDSLKGFAAGG
jgi:SAM-dependent methyltransferase